MAFQEQRKPAEGGSASRGAGPLTAFIDQGSEFCGKLSFKDTVRIDGKLEGEISSDNTLIVGETGEIHADIRSEIVIISGAVEGDIVANRQLTLHKTARVNGNIHTSSLVVEEGAIVNGSMDMSPTSKAAQASAQAPKRSNSEAAENRKEAEGGTA